MSIKSPGVCIYVSNLITFSFGMFSLQSLQFRVLFFFLTLFCFYLLPPSPPPLPFSFYYSSIISLIIHLYFPLWQIIVFLCSGSYLWLFSSFYRNLIIFDEIQVLFAQNYSNHFLQSEKNKSTGIYVSIYAAIVHNQNSIYHHICDSGYSHSVKLYEELERIQLVKISWLFRFNILN